MFSIFTDSDFTSHHYYQIWACPFGSGYRCKSSLRSGLSATIPHADFTSLNVRSFRWHLLHLGTFQSIFCLMVTAYQWRKLLKALDIAAKFHQIGFNKRIQVTIHHSLNIAGLKIGSMIFYKFIRVHYITTYL